MDRSNRAWPLSVQTTIYADHRVTDENEATQFMQTLARFLENPVRMLV